jgi:TonB family protein
MPRDARFWRNVTIIAVAHIALIVTLLRWNREARRPNLQSIVWMSGGTEVAAQSAPEQTETAIEKTPPPETLRSKPEEQDEPAVTTPPPKPSMTPVPNSSPRVTPKPAPKDTRKKPVLAKVTPKPSSKRKATPAEQEGKKDESREKIAPAKANIVNGDKSGSTGPSGAVRASEFSWYGKMLHDRFYSEWIQPTTSIAIGAKISALVKIRIEKDGRISNFTIVKPSGNVVVDESVAAVAKRVTQVDPLPKGLGSGAYYEVNINFELNPEQ